VQAAAAIAGDFTLGDCEDTAIAHGNTHSTEVLRTRLRDLTINVRQHAASAKRDDRSATHRVTSSIERSAHENGDLVSTQRAAISDNMDMISIDKLTISATDLSISDDMDMISVDKPTISAAELSVSDDMDMISPNEAKISTVQGSISLLRRVSF
jgi:hypothetical protein